VDFGQFLEQHGFAAAAAIAAGWFVVRLVNFTLTDLRESLASMEDEFTKLEGITIKLIERHNGTDKTLAEVSERLARVEKQIDIYTNINSRGGVRESERG
jgi:hypothetical protein|tara:strand:- start:51 stop:350 length:300 start_codon:yes stop_codon:yes gene_type:complete